MTETRTTAPCGAGAARTLSLREMALGAYRDARAEEARRERIYDDERRRGALEYFAEQVRSVFGEAIEIVEGRVLEEGDHYDVPRAGGLVDGQLMQATRSGLIALFDCLDCGRPEVYSESFSSLEGYGEVLVRHDEATERGQLCHRCVAARRSAGVLGARDADVQTPEPTLEERLVAALRELVRAEVDGR